MVYQVKWKVLARHLSKHLFIVLAIGLTALMLIRLVSLSFDVDETFRHITLVQMPLAYLMIFMFSVFFGISMGFLFKCTFIKIENDVISGRNYWLFKRSFRMEEIQKVFPFNSNGMPVFIVDAGKKGQIYVPIHIENSDELFAQLDKYA